MALRRLRWRRIAALTMTCCFGAAALGHAQFTSLSDRSRSLLEGNWQSCREGDGHYAERVYDGKWPGMGPFEIHMGPYHEFALFRGIQDAHRDHNSSENLLKPFNIELVGRRAPPDLGNGRPAPRSEPGRGFARGLRELVCHRPAGGSGLSLNAAISSLNLARERYLTPEFVRRRRPRKWQKMPIFRAFPLNHRTGVGYTERTAGTTSAFHIALPNRGNRDI